MPRKVVRLIVIWLAAALLVGAGAGCFIQNVNAGELLRDSVEQLNEGTRWGRLDIAVERVDGEYRREFGERHQHWGSEIEIADYELLGARLAKDEQSAISTVAISWYSYGTMTLHRTVIRQRWKNAGTGYFVLAEERVMGGDETLLVAPRREGEGEDDGADGAGDEAVATRRATTRGGERAARPARRSDDEEDDDWDEPDGESIRMSELAHQ